MEIGETPKEEVLDPETKVPEENLTPEENEPQGIPAPEKTVPEVEEPQVGVQQERAETPEDETPEEKFDYNAEMLKIETHYSERMRNLTDIIEEVFKNDQTYRIWLKDNKDLKIEKDSPAERLMPLAQSLQKKQSEIVEEKNEAILALGKKRNEDRMKRIERI